MTPISSLKGCCTLVWETLALGYKKARRRVCLMLSYPSELSFYSQYVCCLSHPSLFSHALQGHIEPGKEQVLKVYYLPGVPGVFCKTFQIQVGHLEPDKISLKGEASFPRICLDLPRNIKGEHCLCAPQEAPPFWGFGFVFPASCHTSVVQLTPPQAWRCQGCQTNTQPSGCLLNLSQTSLCGLCPRSHPAELASISVRVLERQWLDRKA